MVHAEKVCAELVRRLADGSWPKEPTVVTQGMLALDSIGFTVALIDIYRTTRLAAPPPALD